MDIKNVEGIYPLTPAQEDVLAAWLDAPEAPGHWGRLTCVLDGPLDVDAFGRAWGEAAARHPALRATFAWKRLERPVQVVGRRADVTLEEQDLRGLSECERRARSEEMRRAKPPSTFDPSEATPMRLTLCRTDEESSLFVWDYHRLLLDADGASLIFSEVKAIYNDLHAGRALTPTRAARYSDHVASLKLKDVSEAQAFWRRHLGSAPAPTSLLHEFKAADGPALHEFDEQELRLSESLLSALTELACRLGLSPDSIAAAGWALLLSRYSGREDVVFGRRASARKDVLVAGRFISELPARVRVAGGATVSEWLSETHASECERRAHAQVSQALVRRWVDAPDARPLFESVFAYADARAASSTPAREEGLSITELEISEGASSPLTLTLQAAPEAALRIKYRQDLFDEATAARVLRHYTTLLEGLTVDPERRVSSLPLLTAEERRRLLQGDEGESSEFPSGCLHQLFEEQAARTPHSIAVTYEGRHLSYAELNTRANLLAHRLRREGIDPDTLVGIMMSRSLEMVVSILAVLKAGGAYVPLDPAYPSERLRFMLEDSGARVLLTEESLRESLPEHSAEVVCVDAQWATLQGESSDNPVTGVSPSNLAYVIYTSGSTGRPKGVMVEHRQAARLFTATDTRFSFSSTDVWTLFHSYSFDFSVWELWGALLYGGRLVVVPYLMSRTPESFLRMLSEEGVTVLSQTPSAFRQLCWAEERAGEQTGGETGGMKLRAVVFGGEALEAGSLIGWVERHGDTTPKLVNMYGITETTVHVTYQEVRAGEVEEAVRAVRGGSRVGRAIGDLRVYVLGADGEPVPEGVTGEMYVAGAGLSRGYLNRPALTAERFVPDPFHGSGERMYRTGDVGRWVEGGVLEYLGRCDAQVKVRGHRIELGEIEAALLSHPAIREAVVVLKGEGDKRLVAYLVGGAAARAGSGINAAELREHVSTRLPEYMVPSAYVTLGSLPLTEQGKVDRRALAALEDGGESLAAAGSYVAPRTATEEALAAVWAELLGVERVGVEDNFFELGGHSILAIQVLARVNDIFNVEPPLRRLFETPTVAGLALAVAQAQVELADGEEMAGLLAELEHLSEEDARALASAPTDETQEHAH